MSIGTQLTKQKSQSQAQVKESSNSVLVLAPLLAQRESRAAAVRLARYNYEQCSVEAPFDARVLVQEVQRCSSQILLGLATAVERQGFTTEETSLPGDEDLARRVKSAITRSRELGDGELVTEMRLCASLLDLAAYLREGVRSSLETI